MEEFPLVAYKSFRIRRVDTGASPDANPFGSYVRGTETDAPTGLTRVDSDSSLRADGFIAPVGALDVTAAFVAIATTHTSVQLSWSNFLITNPALNVVTGSTAVVGDFSNAPYDLHVYNQINPAGKQYTRSSNCLLINWST